MGPTSRRTLPRRVVLSGLNASWARRMTSDPSLAPLPSSSTNTICRIFTCPAAPCGFNGSSPREAILPTRPSYCIPFFNVTISADTPAVNVVAASRHSKPAAAVTSGS